MWKPETVIVTIPQIVLFSICNKYLISGYTLGALNAVVHAKVAGCKTSYVGSVGSDASGRAILKKMREKGIDVSRVQVFRTETALTKVSFVGIERQLVEEFHGSVAQFQLTQNVFNYLFEHTLIHNTWQGGTEQKPPEFKRRGGSRISMDFGERFSQEFQDICISYVDVAFFSMDTNVAAEAEAFAKNMHLLGPEYVVITMGKTVPSFRKEAAKPSSCRSRPLRWWTPLARGDTYIGTFLAAFVRREPIPVCMRLATEAAARTCSFFSSFEGSEILDIDQVDVD